MATITDFGEAARQNYFFKNPPLFIVKFSATLKEFDMKGKGGTRCLHNLSMKKDIYQKLKDNTMYNKFFLNKVHKDHSS